MSTTLKRIRTRPHVAHVDDERDLENGIIVTLQKGYFFMADPNCSVRGFDTVKEAETGTRATEVYQERGNAGSDHA